MVVALSFHEILKSYKNSLIYFSIIYYMYTDS